MVDAGMVPRSEMWIQEQDWGRLEWTVSGELGNSQTMTFGRCFIAPGRENPPHYHPNCDEILHVVSGIIEHSLGEERFRMEPGDVVCIPRGVVHNARNIGAEEAVMTIAFDAAWREFVRAV